jgi:hypothetical protein
MRSARGKTCSRLLLLANNDVEESGKQAEADSPKVATEMRKSLLLSTKANLHICGMLHDSGGCCPQCLIPGREVSLHSSLYFMACWSSSKRVEGSDSFGGREQDEGAGWIERRVQVGRRRRPAGANANRIGMRVTKGVGKAVVG